MSDESPSSIRAAWVILGTFWLILAVLVWTGVVPLHPLWVGWVVFLDAIPYFAKLVRGDSE